MTATTSTRPHHHRTRRERHDLGPSREQLRVAAAMFGAVCEDVTAVVVPVVGPHHTDHAETARLGVPGGYWLADHCAQDGVYSFPSARAAAEASAQAHLQRRAADGVPGSVAIRPDGTWSPLL